METIPDVNPYVILITGYGGTLKSTLANQLRDRAGVRVYSLDSYKYIKPTKPTDPCFKKRSSEDVLLFFLKDVEANGSKCISLNGTPGQPGDAKDYILKYVLRSFQHYIVILRTSFQDMLTKILKRHVKRQINLEKGTPDPEDENAYERTENVANLVNVVYKRYPEHTGFFKALEMTSPPEGVRSMDVSGDTVDLSLVVESLARMVPQ